MRSNYYNILYIYINIYFIEKILENKGFFKIKFKGYFMMYKHTFMYTCFGIDKREKRGSDFCSVAYSII